MRILVVGGSGMLGQDVVSDLRCRGHDVEAPAHSDFDLTEPESVATLPGRGPYDWIINCAAYTAVDRAESEADEAAVLNALGPRYLAMACALTGSRFLHVSTDYVFDGSKGSPYTEEDPTNPLQVYGLTKRDGEENVLSAGARAVVVRTAWLYGLHGRCFPRSIVDAWVAGKSLRVVADQVGSPTYTPELARTITDLLERNPSEGIYHAVGPEAMSWHEFAVRTVTAFARATGNERPIDIAAISTAEWSTPAKRPSATVLDTGKLASLRIPPMEAVELSLAKFAAAIAIESRTS